MSDPNESDYAGPPHNRPMTTPPLAKVSREIAMPVVIVSVIACITTALIVGKLSEVAFVGILTTIVGGYLGRAKPEGVVGEHTLERMLQR